MSKRPADGALPTSIFMSYYSQAAFSSFLVSSHFRARAQQGQLTVSTSYMNVTLRHIRLHSTSSTFSQKRRDNRASKITPEQLSFQSILLDCE